MYVVKAFSDEEIYINTGFLVIHVKVIALVNLIYRLSMKQLFRDLFKHSSIDHHQYLTVHENCVPTFIPYIKVRVNLQEIDHQLVMSDPQKCF